MYIGSLYSNTGDKQNKSQYLVKDAGFLISKVVKEMNLVTHRLPLLNELLLLLFPDHIMLFLLHLKDLQFDFALLQ